MEHYRTHATFVGVFYILGTVSGFLSLVATSPGAQSAASQLRLGALSILSMGIWLAMIPVLIYPVLKSTNRAGSQLLGLGYLVLRSGWEGICYVALAVSWLVLAALRGARPELDSHTATLLYETGDLSSVTTFIFCIGAGIFYTALIRTRLIARWIPIWGLLALLPYAAAAVLAMFRIIGIQSGAAVAMSIPLAVQEMVLAVWLIVRGCSPGDERRSENAM